MIDDIAQRLHDTALFLETHRALWEQRPFVGLPVPWEKDWPELSKSLRHISPDQLEKVENDPVAFLAKSAVAPELSETLMRLSDVPVLPGARVSRIARQRGVDERKGQQIAHFVPVMADRFPMGVARWVDWCAGKGHLGVTVHDRFNHPVTCVEINPDLVVQGNRAMQEANRKVVFVAADVLSKPLSAVLSRDTGVVALHACGHLNSRLFELAIEHRPAFLAVVPCCYQRIDGMHFEPLSTAGRHTGLTFTRHQLRLPALDEVKTTASKRQFRKREMAFRQGMDLLLRQATGQDAYTPLGKIPPMIVRGSFEKFCRFAAQNKGLPLPRRIDWSAAEQAGWTRQHLVSALSISRQLFRRVLEIWLFLDRVAYLEENGYQVTYGTFCPREITPRNLMLLATASEVY
ncbi:MAG: methyltransferase [Deltaproteobacteria bacterium]|nr:methyltransferase [Deltaproteobacteria bacterium]